MRFLGILLVGVAVAWGQGPAFENLKIQVSEATPAQRQWLIRSFRVDIIGASLAELVGSAYQVKPNLVAAPDWMHEARFDIAALLPEGVEKERYPELLRVLLAEKFNVKTHKETRPAPAWGVVVAEGGLKVQPAPEGAKPGTSRSARGVEVVGSAMDLVMNTLIATASNLDRPLVNQTGLTGMYLTLMDNTSPDFVVGRSGDANTVRRALERLGLSLVPATTPVEIVVVDSAERMPRAN